MPRAFDTATLVALHDPNRSDLNIRDPRLKWDLAQILIDGLEFIFDAIVSEFGKLLGFDMTQFLADVHTIITNLERLFGDLNPFGGSFNPVDAIMTFIQIIKDALITLPMDLIEGLPAALANLVGGISNLWGMLVGFVEGIPILGQIVEAIIGIPGDLVHLAEWAIGVLTGKSPLFSGNLFGQIGAGIMGLIPGSHIAEASPNLLTDGDFPDASSLVGDEVWTYDAANGHTTPGCASTVCNGVVKDLSSDLIPVAAGQVLAGSGWTMWSGLAGAASHPIKLQLIRYQNTGTSSRPVWAQVGVENLAVDSSGLTGSGWRELAASYTVLAGTDAVRLNGHVDATATAGTVKWDDLSLTKTQKIAQSLISGLTDALGALHDFIQNVVDAIISAIRRVPVVGGALADVLTEMENFVGLGHDAKDTADSAVTAHGNLLAELLAAPHNVIGEITDDIVPGIAHTLEDIWNGLTGHADATGIGHAEAQGVLEQNAAALTSAQAEIALLKQMLTSGVAVSDSFNRSGAIGANWADLPVGGTVNYLHSGAGGLTCDGNNLAWSGSGNVPNTKLVRWIGTGQHSLGQYQAVGIVLGSQGEDPLIGQTSYDHILARVSDDGLNYIRLQVSAYAGNDDDIQLFYALGGVETRLYVGGFSPVVGSGASVYLLAGLKGSNARTHTIIVNNNPIVQITESSPVSWLSATPNTMGWGVGLSAGNDMGVWPFQRQALPGKVNTWIAQDQ